MTSRPDPVQSNILAGIALVFGAGGIILPLPLGLAGLLLAGWGVWRHGRTRFATLAAAACAFATLAGDRLKVHRTRVVAEEGATAAPGTVLPGLVVACGRGAVALESVQREGGKKLDAAAFLAGQRLSEGARLE